MTTASVAHERADAAPLGRPPLQCCQEPPGERGRLDAGYPLVDAAVDAGLAKSKGEPA